MKILITVLMIIFFPFLISGMIRRVKSVWGGRKGPSLIQPFFDFSRLMKKSEVISRTVSPVFLIAPSASLAATICAAMLVPMTGKSAILSFNGDFIMFCYLLALGKFMLVVSAMDTGSSFEGMGSSREVTFSALAEPGFFIIMGSFAWISGCKSFESIFQAIYNSGPASGLLILLAIIGLFIMLLTEGGRLPVDDPETHLELTMIHEVMVLDNSGPDLGFILYGAALKVFLIASLIASLATPTGIGFVPGLIIFTAVVTAEAVFIGFLESVMARMRMTHIPQFVFMITALAIIIFFIVMMELGKAL
jgi:formate hydrogenlyase subunit 4